MTRDTDRGQGFALEGVFAGLLLATALVFALGIVSPASYAAGTSEQSASLHQQADDLLATAADDGTLTRIALCGGVANDSVDPSVSPYNAIGNGLINDTLAERWESGVGDRSPHNATAFGYMLNRTFSERGYQYAVSFAYLNASTDEREVESVYPSDDEGRAPRDAVVATRTVTLYDGMTTTGINASNMGIPEKFCDAGDDGVALSELDGQEFYAEDVAPDRELFNVVEIRVMVW